MKKILFVDDEIQIYKVINRFLQNKYCMDYASDGQEGLLLFNKNKYDLIITDFNMPYLTGIELIDEIRKLDSHIPIVMITGNRDIKKDDIYIIYKPLVMDKIQYLLNLIEQHCH